MVKVDFEPKLAHLFSNLILFFEFREDFPAELADHSYDNV
jgi:hypothetical protein